MAEVKCVWVVMYRKAGSKETPILEIWTKEPSTKDMKKIRSRYVETRRNLDHPHRCTSCGGVDIFVQREELGDRKWHEEPVEGP